VVALINVLIKINKKIAILLLQYLLSLLKIQLFIEIVSAQVTDTNFNLKCISKY